MTFVGVYQSKLIINHPGPVSLPRLCVVLTAQTPKEKPFESLRFRILQDDTLLREIVISPEHIQTANKLSDDEPSCSFHSYGAVITLQPFNIEKNCVLRIRADTESEELAASALQIILDPSESPSLSS
ncbi:hypothetical protein [Herminiimonas sp. CN]|uniref:hypothetical protein n=1 Tax=Herminiimonas sp. CN TaxID=1349818 RepID=UPI0012DCA39A|nr:hypothetical protein [Herminiimonas sp. CN]